MDGPDTGHVVYFIIAGHFVKVGYSNYVWSRLKELQTGNPYELILAHTIGYKSKKEALKGEKRWRNLLARCGKPRLGEWVELEDDVIGPIARRLENRRIEFGRYTPTDNSKEGDVEWAMRKYGLRARLVEGPI